MSRTSESTLSPRDLVAITGQALGLLALGFCFFVVAFCV
jgi:hypothetical protein